MKILEALGELAETVRYLDAQPLARRLDPVVELRRLEQATEALKTAVKIDREPNKIEVSHLAERCRLVNFDLEGFSHRELRLLAWHDGLLTNPRFRQNLLTLVQSDQVRPNLSVLAKVYFGAWGQHERPMDFESLLHWVA